MVRRDVKRLPPSRRQYVRTFPALQLARGIPGVRPASAPGFIEPSLATLHPKPPRGDQWVHEIKYDGYRLQLHINEGHVQLFTRRGHDWTERFETIVLAAWNLKTYKAIIDGEVIVPAGERAVGFSCAGARPRGWPARPLYLLRLRSSLRGWSRPARGGAARSQGGPGRAAAGCRGSDLLQRAPGGG